jgi:hydroxylamine dehydrogenase
MGRIIFSGFALLVMAATILAVTPGHSAASDSCLDCHAEETPGIVKQWQQSKHPGAEVGCDGCHLAKDGDPSGYDHNGFKVTAVPSPKYCADCHKKEVDEYSNSKHAWTAFIGPLKPYWLKATDQGLDPLAQETAKKLNPEEIAKRALTPLFPDSGILKKIGLLDDKDYNHNNVVLGCIECHGSFLIAGKDGELQGWPNAGVGRINPDGSLGACSACHTRHTFSVAEARKPETCGQCHLGPDHPQAEIYEESKHGNIFNANVEHYNMEAADWGTDDITAPTCATCHMSTFNGIPGSHDAGARLYWELQPKKSVPQWKNPGQVKDFIRERVPDEVQAAKNRKQMKEICGQCHSPRWIDGYFVEYEKVISDYNKLWDYTDGLLKEAYAEELISKDNPIDETPEIQHYLIWHHDGRRMRMGAAMMAPDWTHWNGAVDAIMNKLGTMVNDVEMRRRVKALEGK